MLKKLIAPFVLCACLFPALIQAADYEIDSEGHHAFIQFRIKHLGYSWLYGRFNKFEGRFTFDEQDPAKNKVQVVIDMNSLDTSHPQRNKHVLSADYLDAQQYPQAAFHSTKVDVAGNKARISGDLTLHGVTRAISIDVHAVGQGEDPWGGYRAGFEGRTVLKLHDFNIDNEELGSDPMVELLLDIEGIRQ